MKIVRNSISGLDEFETHNIYSLHNFEVVAISLIDNLGVMIDF